MEKKVCPDCKREFDFADETCVDCGTRLEIVEVLNYPDWLIAVHDPVRENLDGVRQDLAAHGIEGKVAFVNLSDFEMSISAHHTWALLVEREQMEKAVETLRTLYGFTEDALQEEVQAAAGQYAFLGFTEAAKASVEELAADASLYPRLCQAVVDENAPEPLVQKASEALIAAGRKAEDEVLAALLREIRTDHYVIRSFAFEQLLAILLEIGTAKTALALVNLATEPESTVRINAVHCIAELSVLRDPRVLLPLLEDEDEDVRQEANQALEQLAEKSAYPDYIYTPEDGARAREAWTKALEG